MVNHRQQPLSSTDARRLTAPPGPPTGLGGLGHLRRVRRDFRQFAHELHQRHGDVARFSILGQPVYLFAHPELAHELLVAKSASFAKPHNQKRAFARVIGNNLFTSDGDAWTTRRRLLGPLFSPKAIDRFPAVILRQAAAILESLPNGVTDLDVTFHDIALMTVAVALFGNEVLETRDTFREIAGALQAAVARQIASPMLLPLWFPSRDNRTIRRALGWFRPLIRGWIARRRGSLEKAAPTAPGADLLSALLAATDSETGTRLSESEVIDEALTFLLAGSDTTASALTWAAYLLARHPDQQRRLRAEVVGLSGGAPLEPHHLGRLAHAERVFEEAMRLYPPAVAIARQATRAVAVGQTNVPKGALAFASVYSIHHDARWFPDPESFRPERFADPLPEPAYLPFGLGPRACIGRRLAVMEGTLVLAELARRFEWSLLPGAPDPMLETRLAMHPRDGMAVRLNRIA